MVVLVLEHAPDKLKGMLTRWLIEARTGTYVGHVNALVRDKIWEMIGSLEKEGVSAIMIFSDNNEQGFSIRMVGEPQRSVVLPPRMWG